jgi:hypothetical protein
MVDAWPILTADSAGWPPPEPLHDGVPSTESDPSGGRRWGLVAVMAILVAAVVGAVLWFAVTLWPSDDGSVVDESIARGPTPAPRETSETDAASGSAGEAVIVREPEQEELDPPLPAAETDVVEASEETTAPEQPELEPPTGRGGNPDAVTDANSPMDSIAADGFDEADGTGEAEVARDRDTDSQLDEQGSEAVDGLGPGGDSVEAAQRTVTIDEQCIATVDESVLSSGNAIRAWDYQECRWAPIPLGPGQEQWVVVYTSLNGNDFDATDALERASDSGVPGNVMWSSHYPSLNPGVWVIYEGPFATENEAKAATRRVGGRAYPRVLTDDIGDRYCVGFDNCVGETADDR